MTRFIAAVSDRWTPTVHCVAVAALAIALSTALTGCATTKAPIKPAVEQVPVEVAVPVATGCIADTGRPARPAPINQTVAPDEWAKRAPGAKAEAIKAQAGTRMNYEDQDRAATSGCK